MATVPALEGEYLLQGLRPGTLYTATVTSSNGGVGAVEFTTDPREHRPLLGADVEALLVRLVGAAFPDYKVANAVPSGQVTSKMITVYATGAQSSVPVLDNVHVNVLVHHPSPEEVMGEALRVQAFLHELRTPVIRFTSASLPSRVEGGDDSPRRYLYADIKLRKMVQTT